MFTRGDVMIFTAGTALLGMLWDSKDENVIQIRENLLSGAELNHVEQALMKLTLIAMMDNQQDQAEESKAKKKERKTKISHTSEDGDINMVFTVDD